MLNTPSSLAQLINEIDEFAQSIEGIRHDVAEALSNALSKYEGTIIESVDTKKEIADSLQAIADSIGMRFRCPSCGEPAILRASATGNSPSGVFQFDHTSRDQRSTHGGLTTLPPLRLVPSPKKRRR